MASDQPQRAPAEQSFDFKLYRYNPSLPAAIVAVVVFAILTAYHGWLMRRWKAYYFTPFFIGGVCESQQEQETHAPPQS